MAERSLRVLRGLDREQRAPDHFVLPPLRIRRAAPLLAAVDFAPYCAQLGLALPGSALMAPTLTPAVVVDASPFETERILDASRLLPAFVAALLPRVRVHDLESHAPFDGEVEICLDRDWVRHDALDLLAIVLVHESGHVLFRLLCDPLRTDPELARKADFLGAWERACVQDLGLATHYGQRNAGEDIAESLVVYVLGLSSPQVAARIEKLMPNRLSLLRAWLDRLTTTTT